MILIADSGATKTDWRLIMDDGTVRSAISTGLNPSVIGNGHVNDVIGSVIPGLNPQGKMVNEIHFYGAGLVDEAASSPLAAAFALWCPFARLEFHSDMLAAARALFGDGSGIVAILGTGSNSCLYENGEIKLNIRPGGFILGDEGSGAALGKAFISDFIKGLVPELLEAEFVARYDLDYAKVVRKVYKEPAPSAYLASFAPFLLEYQTEPYVMALIQENVDAFLKRSLLRYLESYEREGVTAGVVGSFGCACEHFLRKAGGRYGLEFTEFLKSPIDRLVEYHSR